jgi:hypothetical protein
VLVGLALGLPLGLPLGLGLLLVLARALVLALGLAAMKAASEAEMVAEAVAAPDVRDDDGEGDPVPEGDDAEGEPECDGEGDTDALLALDAGAVGEVAAEEADGDDGGFIVIVGVGVGVGVLAAGSTSHLLSVFAPALVEVPGLGEAAPSFTVPARATPGQPASTPRVRKTPVSRLRAAARTCARRMKIALTRRGYCVLFVGFGGDWVTDGYEQSYPVPG